VPGQVQRAEKSNEITAIPRLPAVPDISGKETASQGITLCRFSPGRFFKSSRNFSSRERRSSFAEGMGRQGALGEPLWTTANSVTGHQAAGPAGPSGTAGRRAGSAGEGRGLPGGTAGLPRATGYAKKVRCRRRAPALGAFCGKPPGRLRKKRVGVAEDLPSAASSLLTFYGSENPHPMRQGCSEGEQRQKRRFMGQ
jgi:hypothetical protein